jgi:hypothetical protein
MQVYEHAWAIAQASAVNSAGFSLEAGVAMSALNRSGRSEAKSREVYEDGRSPPQ